MLNHSRIEYKKYSQINIVNNDSVSTEIRDILFLYYSVMSCYEKYKYFSNICGRLFQIMLVKWG